jgi:hypothetical protein
MASKFKLPQVSNFDQNPIEAVRDIGSGVIDSLKKDLGQEAASAAWRQLLKPTEPLREGPQPHQMSGDLEEGQEIDIFKKDEWAMVEPAINYKDTYRKEIIHFEERATTHETGELKSKLEEIQFELIKLSKSSQELKISFKDVSVHALPENPGKYHLNFFEWALSTIRNARMRIEESASWLNVVSGKKNRKDYWSLSKKHGTSYSLSGERAVAQQVG